MIKVLFVCHGNICRSPMAEYIFREMIDREGLTGLVAAESAGTSAEELGRPVYPEARAYLRGMGIDPDGKRAKQVCASDFDDFDFIVAMERYNLTNLRRFGGRVRDGQLWLLRDFSDEGGDIEDPWYSGNFDVVGRQIREGCEGLVEWLKREYPELKAAALRGNHTGRR
ncbi:MAG: low molecular weight phosphotyrosine protein phosphatase [Clostridia bacterium]|nr:low molecular weight phosphotyrosine protein phosphatase [Clostridia bacterium]